MSITGGVDADGDSDAATKKKREMILRQIRFGAMAPEFFFSKVKSSGLLNAEDYVAVCESFIVARDAAAAAGAGAAAADADAGVADGILCKVKRSAPPMVALFCRGKESPTKLLGFTPSEKVGEFMAKVKIVLEIEERFVLKDTKGMRLCAPSVQTTTRWFSVLLWIFRLFTLNMNLLNKNPA